MINKESSKKITLFYWNEDVNTQASYQLMDSGFIGLIFSCFNNDESSQMGRVQVISFQSVKTGNK
jgi:BRCA1/BRCA2-containing complex subunit 3